MHKIPCLSNLYILYWLIYVYLKLSFQTLETQRIFNAFVEVFNVCHVSNVSLFCVMFTVQDRHSERHKDSRLNLRPPSHSATYATVSAWHHQPEKLILDSCGYEATVSHIHCLQNRSRQTLLLILTAYSRAPTINQIVVIFWNDHQLIWELKNFFRKWSKFSDPIFLNMNIFWFLYSSKKTLNGISLYSGQSQIFQDAI